MLLNYNLRVSSHISLLSKIIRNYICNVMHQLIENVLTYSRTDLHIIYYILDIILDNLLNILLHV